MKVLLAHRYFWPDTPPYASMLREIATRLADDGHEVVVFSSQPSYKESVAIEARPRRERCGSFEIFRCRLLPESKRNWIARALNSVSFLVQFLAFAVFRFRPALVMISTMPPVLAGYTGLLAARATSSRFIYHCQDIHPEAARLAGVSIVGQGMGFSFLRWLDRQTVAGADRVVVLSQDMAQTLLNRKGADGRVEVINNFALTDGEPKPPDDSDMIKRPGVFRVLFAGNIGTFQGLDTVIQAARLLERWPEVEFVFVGEGAASDALREQAGPLAGRTVRFFAHQPLEIARYLMSDADLGLVTLSHDIFRVAYPSKTMTYLMEGCPILAMVEPESELAQFLDDRRVGIVISPGDAKGLAKAVQDLAADRAAAAAFRQRASEVGSKTYSPDVVLDRWTSLIDELAPS